MNKTFEEQTLELITAGVLPKGYLTEDREGHIYVKQEVRDGLTEKEAAILQVVLTLLEDKDRSIEDMRDGLIYIKKMVTPWSKRDECEDCD